MGESVQTKEEERAEIEKRKLTANGGSLAILSYVCHCLGESDKKKVESLCSAPGSYLCMILYFKDFLQRSMIIMLHSGGRGGFI